MLRLAVLISYLILWTTIIFFSVLRKYCLDCVVEIRDQCVLPGPQDLLTPEPPGIEEKSDDDSRPDQSAPTESISTEPAASDYREREGGNENVLFYYSDDNGSEAGPITSTQLLQIIRAKVAINKSFLSNSIPQKMNPKTTFAWKVGMTNWATIDEIHELMAFLVPPVPLISDSDQQAPSAATPEIPFRPLPVSDNDTDSFPRDCIETQFGGFNVINYTTRISVMLKDDYRVVVGPNTRFGEHIMPQADPQFLNDFTAYQSWKGQGANCVLGVFLSLGLINMYHFTRMSKAHRFAPTDVEFFQTFHWVFGLIVWFVRWGSFYLITVHFSESSNVCAMTSQNYVSALLLSLYILYSRMNVDIASMTQGLLSIPPYLLLCQFMPLNLCQEYRDCVDQIFQKTLVFFQIKWRDFVNQIFHNPIKSVREKKILPILDTLLTFWASYEIIRSKFCSGTYLVRITGYAFLLTMDKMFFEIFGPQPFLLEFYGYESKVKAMNTLRATLNYTSVMYALTLLGVLLTLLLLLFDFNSVIIEDSPHNTTPTIRCDINLTVS
jgi:hypothetical protein